MKLFSTSTVFLLFSALFCRNAWAQATSPASEVRAAQVAQLQAWGTKGIIESPSPLNLDVRVADLQTARATEPLQNWVRAGGIVILHTDAAQAFGFSTVQARERTFDRAGQLWGRGGNALPFGGSSLLLGGRSQSRRGLTDGVPGVRTVFYQLQSGDAVLHESGAAVVPLLRVEDNTLPENGKADPTFYAAAMRRYGKGWALFLPRTIEARADGTQFQQNLDAFIKNASQGQWLTLPVAAIQAAYKPASQQQNVDWQQLRDALRPSVDPKTLPVVSDEAQLILSNDDAKAIDATLQQIEAAPKDDNLQTSGRALIYLLAARALWQLDSDDGAPSADAKLAALWGTSSAARETLWQAQSDGPAANMTRWWNGIFALGAALPPIPTSYETELIAFSYVRPALEAAQWWQGVSSNDENLAKIVGLAGAAAQQMAQQHKDDPPLLSYWKTDSGTRYYMQLFPIQAASDKFPPSPQEWGMPMRSITLDQTHISTWLVPIGGGKEMPVGIVPEPIIWPEYNTVRPRMFWVFSQVWSGSAIQNQGFEQEEQNVAMSSYLNDQSLNKSNVTFGGNYDFFQPFLHNDAIYLRCAVDRPIPSWPAYLKQIRVENVQSDIKDYHQNYIAPQPVLTAIQESYAFATPSRVAYLQAQSLLKFWLEDEDVPGWMYDGLGNIFSLNVVNVIDRNQINFRNISPSYAIAETANDFTYSKFSSYISSLSRVHTFVAQDPEKELTDPAPDITWKQEVSGTPLKELDSTNQVNYFYKRFGAGAFVETLQRLGSGQGIDAALLATTGLNQQQFFAVANAN